MTNPQRPSLLALSALLLCTLPQTAGSHQLNSSSSSSSASSSEVRDRNNVTQNWLRQTNVTPSDQSRPSSKREEVTGHVKSSSFNTSGGNNHHHHNNNNNNTVISDSPGRAPRWSPEDVPSPVCAYRVIEGGIGGQLCFRHTLFGYKCSKGECRSAVSFGKLVANILTNGSVLLQWTHESESTKTKEVSSPGTNATAEETSRSDSVFRGRRHRRGGYEVSCWWNGSYTQFECAGVHLGSGCRDFLLSELHENIPYRICLRALGRSEPAERPEQDCVEFTLPPSGMQDIVIAMTTVGGAICVMLVIICLLVAYITENIMSPAAQHTHSYRAHSHH
ncbi:beta-1,3-N-acetylgalactosaminyltransferase 2 [Sarotherodon galilaeus]